MKYGNVTMGQVEAAINKLGGLSGWQALLDDKLEVRSKMLGTTRMEQSNLLTVSADISFAERITLGRYDWCNSDLTEKRFPVTADQIGEFEWKLFHFGRDISSDEAIRLKKAEGFEPGQIGHLLVFGEQYPEEQRKYPIVALGSAAKVGLERNVPGLWVDYAWRDLRLGWYGGVWYPCYRFLGVRRRSVA